MFSKNFKSLRFMLLIFLVTTFLMNYVLINAYIPSGSMENTIMTGDRVIGLRFIRHYNRGDIVIFPDPDGGGYYLIKRIIGLPGDATDYSLDDRYRLRELNYTQNGKTWHVTYGGYTSDTQPALPSNVELNNGAQRIKLKMDNWIVK